MADKKMYKVGLTVKEPWSPDISYEELDITLFAVESGGDGCSYTAIKPNQGVTPGTDDTVWVKSTQAGQSIYDLAVKYHHFVGTEEEFEQQYQDALAAANNAASAASATDEQIQANELARVSAENSRVTAERARSDAETARSSAETARINAENARNNAESLRDIAESDRVRAEAGRVTAEASRVEAETFRQGAEQSRRQQFEALKTDMNTAIDNVDAKAAEIEEDIEGYEANEASRVTAEQSRVSAESSRVSAESARATAETARETQASSDHTRAETDHGTAASDHTTAAADHAQAGQDHTLAAADHTTAAADHTQAGTDHTASETATQAAIAAAEAATEAAGTIDEKIATKADKDGYYGGMTVGAAENLVGRGTTDAEYAGVRTSAGTADIGSGSATIARMRGRSFKWNQLVQNGNFADGTRGFTFAPSVTSHTVNDGECTIVKDALRTDSDAAVMYVGNKTGFLPTNHKILASAELKIIDVAQNSVNPNARIGLLNGISGYGTTQIASTNKKNTWVRVANIMTTNDTYRTVAVACGQFSDAYETTYSVRNFFLIDLTLMFGSGNEPATVEEFDEWRKEMGLTLDYYAYNEGEVINNRAAAIETVGFNLYDYSTGKAFLPGVYSSYPHEYEICGTFTSISFRDVNGNESVPELTDGRFFNVPGPGELTVVGGNNTDTLVHRVWSGWRNEGEPDYTYEPYWKNTLNLGLTTLKGKLNGAGDSVVVFPTGLAKIGDVRDEIVGNKAIKKIGSRGYVSGDESDTTVITDGHSLTYYILATPEEYTLDEPMPSQYRVDDFGTERVIPSYSPSELTAPIAYDVQYAMNAVDAIRRLDDNYVNESQVKQTAGRSETDVYSQKGVDDNYAKKVGLEENLVSGLSRNLAGKDVQTGEFATAVISGADGLAKINEVMGKSLVWNQLVQNGDFSDGTTGWVSPASSLSVNDSTLTISAQAKYGRTEKSVSINNNRIYILSAYIVSDDPVHIQLRNDSQITNLFDNATTNGWNHYIVNVTGLASGDVINMRILNYASANWNPIYVKNVTLIDLTLMFGTGNEPSTVEEFEALFPAEYYEYNEGEIISNKTESLRATGFNQWDEEWEVGGISETTGNSISAQCVRSKNYIPVIAESDYFFKVRYAGTSGIYVKGYDANKTVIGSTWLFANVSNAIKTIPSGVSYIRFMTLAGYGTTYNHDICINVSGSRNGEYEPYQKSELELNLATITGKLNGDGESVTIFPDGMRSAGTAFDSLIVDEDGYARKAVKRVWSVDLGSINWTYNAPDSTHPNGWFSADKPSGLVAGDASNKANMISSRLITVNSTSVATNGNDKTISASGYYLFVGDSAYTDASTFKTAMSGVMLYYELATPEEYVLDTPIQMTFQAKHGGVIRQLPENGSEPTTAPMRMSVTYALDAVSILTDLPENYVSKESLQAMLSAMQSAGLFSAYTMTFNESTGKYEFTFTANA